FFCHATHSTDLYTLSLHDALPICRGICHSRYATARRLMPNVKRPKDRIICDMPGDWSSAIVVTTFVWTKYPAPVKNALASVGLTRTPIPRPTAPAIRVLGITRVHG